MLEPRWERYPRMARSYHPALYSNTAALASARVAHDSPVDALRHRRTRPSGSAPGGWIRGFAVAPSREAARSHSRGRSRGDGECETGPLARYWLASRRREITFGRQSTTARSAGPIAKGLVRLAASARSHPARTSSAMHYGSSSAAGDAGLARISLRFIGAMQRPPRAGRQLNACGKAAAGSTPARTRMRSRGTPRSDACSWAGAQVAVVRVVIAGGGAVRKQRLGIGAQSRASAARP